MITTDLQDLTVGELTIRHVDHHVTITDGETTVAGRLIDASHSRHVAGKARTMIRITGGSWLHTATLPPDTTCSVGDLLPPDEGGMWGSPQNPQPSSWAGHSASDREE